MVIFLYITPMKDLIRSQASALRCLSLGTTIGPKEAGTAHHKSLLLGVSGLSFLDCFLLLIIKN